MDGLSAGALIAQRYRLSAPLGTGAQGAVWEAVDTHRSGALRAIKFAAVGATPGSEASLLLTVEHPSLPRAMDLGVHAQRHFLVLERIHGVALDRAHGPRAILRAIADVAQALAALHDAGLVHGDVKPANILVGPERAWLVDLGLAGACDPTTPSGTLAFLAPEVLTGERGTASDLYALGVTAVWALTGLHPLVETPGERASLLTALARRTGPRPSVLALLPAACREAITQLLAPEPERRPQSARAFLGRLARDAGAELTTAQRTLALAHGAEPLVRTPLVGRDDACTSAVDAMEAALCGKRIGVVFTGAEGAGRRRTVDEVIRQTQIAWVARGALPEVVDALPAEPSRPTIVRCIDAEPGALDALTTAIARMRRYAHGVPMAVIASTTTMPQTPALHTIDLAPIEPMALDALLTVLGGRAPSDPARDAWNAATGALPGRLVTMADALGAALVPTATAAQLARVAPVQGAGRIERLAPDVQRVAWTLVASARPLAIGELAEMLERPSVRIEANALLAAGIAIERDGRLALSAPTAIDCIPEPLRGTIGERLEAYTARHAPALHAVRARAALLRNDVAAARSHLLAAAADPSASAFDRTRWIETARDLTDPSPARDALTVRAAGERLRTGDAQGALRALEPLADAPAVLALRADALRRAGGAEQARTLARELAGMDDPGARTVSALVLARDALDHGDTVRASETLGALADGHGAPDDLRARALETGALLALGSNDPDRALGRIRTAETLAHAVADRVQQARLRSLHGIAQQLRGAHEAALRAYREAWALASEAGDEQGAATYAVNRGAAELECGAPGEALVWLSWGVRALARLGRMGDLARALLNLAALHAFIGDHSEALDTAQRAESAAMEAQDRALVLAARALSAEASLRGEAVGEALAAMADEAAASGYDSLAREFRARSAEAYARSGSIDRAEALLRTVASPPSALEQIALLRCALVRSNGVDPAMGTQLAAARAAVQSERTSELDLLVLALGVQLHEQQGDAAEARRARAAHGSLVRSLAATLPDGPAAVFTDTHALAERTQPVRSIGSGVTVPDDRWRRLAEIAREINREHRLRPLLERVMDAIIELTGAARGFLLLKGPDGTLRIRTARNLGQRDLASDEMSLSRSVAERVAHTGEPLVAVDATSDRRLDAFESVHAMQLRSILAVPLRVQGTTEGTVYVDDRFRIGAFGDDALEIAREFAEAAAVAITNARNQTLLRRALRRSERLARELRKRVDAQTVELEATRRALGADGGPRGRYEEIIGRGPAITRTLQLVDKVSPTAMPALLLGESGTGKELIARALHANSPRAARPFVAENCGAIPETLLESVLFGHVRGAFTGADRNRAGLFEIADGGTLFLDEIGEMSASMQSRLLRVLQDGEVRPLGGDRTRHVDVRVIAATHRDLGEMVRQGRFREDLYYRLAVMIVPVPPLRERREDIPALVAHFIERHGAGRVGVDRRALARLMAYHWPGNVRQLQNEMMRACVMAEGTIREDDLTPALLGPAPVTDATGPDTLELKSAVEQLERQMIEKALKNHGGNQSRAARELGLSRFGLQKKLKRFGTGAPTDPTRELA